MVSTVVELTSSRSIGGGSWGFLSGLGGWRWEGAGGLEGDYGGRGPGWYWEGWVYTNVGVGVVVWVRLVGLDVDMEVGLLDLGCWVGYVKWVWKAV